jgi:hypothetical protein
VVSAAEHPTTFNPFSRPEPLLFLSSSSSFILTRAEWTPFQTHYYSENLAAPGIEPGTSVSSQELRPRDHRGGLYQLYVPFYYTISIEIQNFVYCRQPGNMSRT